jgi:hypothetical protein
MPFLATREQGADGTEENKHGMVPKRTATVNHERLLPGKKPFPLQLPESPSDVDAASNMREGRESNPTPEQMKSQKME